MTVFVSTLEKIENIVVQNTKNIEVVLHCIGFFSSFLKTL